MKRRRLAIPFAKKWLKDEYIMGDIKRNRYISVASIYNHYKSDSRDKHHQLTSREFSHLLHKVFPKTTTVHGPKENNKQVYVYAGLMRRRQCNITDHHYLRQPIGAIKNTNHKQAPSGDNNTDICSTDIDDSEFSGDDCEHTSDEEYIPPRPYREQTPEPEQKHLNFDMVVAMLPKSLQENANFIMLLKEQFFRESNMRKTSRRQAVRRKMQTDTEILVQSGHGDGSVYKVTNIEDTMMHDDPMSDDSNDSTYETELMQHVHAEVHTETVPSRNLADQLSQSGPAGVAAAAAIASFKKKRKPHSFETNPAIRKRQQTRILRKIRHCIEEYTIRCGQQAAFLAVTPSRGRDSNNSYKVFGSQPLENVLKDCRNVIVQDLESVLATQAPPPLENSHLFELPPLLMEGMPTPLEKMTQAHLRAFIPEMLKYSTGRSKPGWGKMECQPLWWPADVPWANIRCDVRSEEDKKALSWTSALRSIIRNCYKHHGREDLLPAFEEETTTAPFVMQTINNPDGSLSIIQIDTSCSQIAEGSEIITLADGTQATVVRTIPTDDLDDVGSDDNLNTRLAEATLTSDGAIMIPDGGGEMVQLPVSVYNGALMVGHLDGDTSGLTSFTQNKSESSVPPSTQTVEIS